MHSKLHLSVLATISCLPLLTGAAQMCPAGTTPVSVTGRVTSLNLSTTKSVGQVCLTMTTADGREVFDDCGALLGKVISSDPATGTNIVTDTAVFDMMDSFRSAPHMAQITGILETDADGNPCSVSVSEHTTSLQSGTGIFTNASLDVYANGTVSACPGKNLNAFQLTGQGCVKTRRH
jgi:hypothetical protein